MENNMINKGVTSDEKMVTFAKAVSNYAPEKYTKEMACSVSKTDEYIENNKPYLIKEKLKGSSLLTKPKNNDKGGYNDKPPMIIWVGILSVFVATAGLLAANHYHIPLPYAGFTFAAIVGVLISLSKLKDGSKNINGYNFDNSNNDDGFLSSDDFSDDFGRNEEFRLGTANIAYEMGATDDWSHDISSPGFGDGMGFDDSFGTGMGFDDDFGSSTGFDDDFGSISSFDDDY